MKARRGRLLTFLTAVIFMAACTAAPTTTPPPGTAIPLPTLTPTAPAPAATAAHTATPTASGVKATTAMATLAPAVEAATAPARTNAPRIMALGRQIDLTLRQTPGGTTAAIIPGSTVLWVEGRSAGGGWWLVAYAEGTPAPGQPAPERRAWVAQGDVDLFGDAAGVAAVPADAAQQPALSPAMADSQAHVGAGSPATVGTATDGALAGRVNADQLNVRAAPGLGQPALGLLNAGDTVSVTAISATGKTPAWLQIDWQGRAGWVAAQYIQLAGNAANLPVSATPVVNVATPASRPAAIGGKIAIQTSIGGDIYVVNADGSGLRRLTSGIDPAFSPDGTLLAFTRWSPDGVWVLDMRNGQERQVSPGKHPRGPTWSADGTRLVFANVAKVTTCYQTQYVCLSEAQLGALLHGKDCADTPLGRLCRSTLPVSHIEETGLVRVMVADGAWQDLPAQLPAQSPQWYPGGEEILYRVNDGLQKAPTDPNGKSWPLVVNQSRYNSPALSPDGMRIAIQDYLHDHYDLFILDAAGQVQVRLTQPAFLATKAVQNVAPAWSPDGRTILFLTDRDGTWHIYRVDADGANQAPFLPNVLSKITLRYDYAAERVMSWGR